MPYDQYGEWYDDGTDLPPDQGGGGYDLSTMFNSPYMQAQMPGQNFSTSKWNFGQELPVGQNVYNQILTGTKNLAQLQTNPSLLYNAMIATGQPTMDMNQLSGFDQYGMPTGGGGGGGANGYQSVFTTPYLDSLQQSGDPDQQWIYDGVINGGNPLSIMAEIKKRHPEFLPEDLQPYSDAINKAFTENAEGTRNQLRGAEQSTAQTPIQEWLSKNGLVNPMEQYTADNLPGDVDVSGAGMEAAKSAQDAVNAAASTGAHIKALNDERSGLRDKAVVANGIRDVKQLGMEQAVKRYLEDPTGGTGEVQPNGVPAWQTKERTKPGAKGAPASMGGISYDAKTGEPIYADIPGPGGQHNIYDPSQGAPRQDTGDVGGWGGGWMRPIRDAAAQRFNPSGDVARMAMLKRAAAGQERRKQNLVRSAQAAPAYEQAMRQLAAHNVQQTGRTPAGDAQQAILRYMQQGGLR